MREREEKISTVVTYILSETKITESEARRCALECDCDAEKALYMVYNIVKQDTIKELVKMEPKITP
jgi:redox-regulated HSP33 family molecular chaperone